MPYIHSDPKRENEPHALPNVEVFWQRAHYDAYGDHIAAGFYWQACFPGCMPDGEANGPYETEDDACDAAQEE